MTHNPVFCAFDMNDENRAMALADTLGEAIGGVKIGMEFFYGCGVAGYQKLATTGHPIFLDLKLHDIPNTVAGAVRSLLPLKPALLNVHAAGGAAMMRAAKKAAGEASGSAPSMLAVTIMTALDDSDLHAMGVSGSAGEQVLRLAALAGDSGMDGVVCAAHEIESLRNEMGAGFKLVVPGIRPKGSDVQDQKRTMTPQEAYQAGADVLVIGRPITGADNPRASADEIVQSLRL